MPRISLNELAGGALMERINIELERVAANIADPNTKATAVRKVTVTIALKPDENREVVQSVIDVKSSLAPANGIPTNFIVDRDRSGKVVIDELAPGARKNQLRLSDDGEITDHKGEPVPQEDSGKIVKFR